MNRSLSDLVDNLSEINKQECIICKERKNKSIDCKHIGYASSRVIYKCDECKNRSCKPIAPLIETFPSTYQFCNGDNNKFVLLLRKCPRTPHYTTTILLVLWPNVILYNFHDHFNHLTFVATNAFFTCII